MANLHCHDSAYDTDVAGYRLVSLEQVVGVLVPASGLPTASLGGFTNVTMGCQAIRICLVAAAISARLLSVW